MPQAYRLFFLIFFALGPKCNAQTSNDYLLLFADSAKDAYGYKNQHGVIVIPADKYSICYTDTFRLYAIVLKQGVRFVAINRQEKVLYKIFPFDNGPDEASNGLFRIIEQDKIGYADARTGKVVIKPRFACAWPYEKGIAKVSEACRTQTDGEHSYWQSKSWYYINKKGIRITNSKLVKKQQ